MTSTVRSGAIARRKAATRERYVVNDDGGCPGLSPAAWDVFRILAVLDAATLPADYIQPDDVELLEWADVPEFEDS